MRVAILSLLSIFLFILGTLLRDIYRPYAIAAYVVGTLVLGLLVASFAGWL